MNSSLGFLEEKLTQKRYRFPTTAGCRHLDDPSFRWPSQPRRCLVPWLDNGVGGGQLVSDGRSKVGFCCVFLLPSSASDVFFLCFGADLHTLDLFWFLLIGFIYLDWCDKKKMVLILVGFIWMNSWRPPSRWQIDFTSSFCRRILRGVEQHEMTLV